MLYIDGISLSKLKDELDETLKGRKVTKIFQYSPLSLSVFLGKINLYISATPNLPICYTATKKEVAPDKPMSFSLSLRKYVVGAILTGVEQYKNDRILLLSFEKINELGVKQKVKMIVEIMGKHSNIILVDDNFMILDLLKKFSIEENKLRLLMGGAKYQFPIVTEKKSPMEISKEEFDSYLADNTLIQNVDGIGKLTAKYMTDYNKFSEIINEAASPTLYKQDGTIKYGTILNLPLTGYEEVKFESINSMIDTYILETLNSEQFNNQKRTLAKVVEKEIKRNKKTMKNVNKDREKYSTYEKYKKIGDILAANLYSLKGYEKSVILYDFYENCNIEISLNPQRTSNENLDNYYNLYNKHKRGYQHSGERLEIIKSEIIYLESILSFINHAQDKKTLEGIEEELIANKYLKKIVKTKKKKKVAKIMPPTTEIDGFTVYYGRNNIENEYVTFKIGDRHDLWFHAKDVPGSHLIVKTNGEEISDDTLYKVGELASQHSKVGQGETIRIDYCLKKYVKKIKGAKPGLVIYSNEKSVFVKKG
ncbi:Rqc2 family fibronectin-binding protein [Psychrilyobacter atlanticus]|uniref:Rqc2 family fibronectin-binding protein n=1 Tax=Psychrilyobacter atlanticus TaxID=271091 RepID=UPI0003F916D3|nr:NFACT family protein [Psychrilyobacter atlanticus]